MKELQPIFTRLSTTRFCGVRRVRIAVCETVPVFNTGAGSKAAVMYLCGITSPGAQTMKAFREQDRVLVKAAAKKISSKYRERSFELSGKKRETKMLISLVVLVLVQSH